MAVTWVKAAILVLPLALAACAKPAAPPACPTAKIASQYDRHEVMGGPGAGDLRWRASMTGFTGGCDYSGGELSLIFDLEMTLVSGPKAPTTPETIAVGYFIAYQNPAGEIVDIASFTVPAEVGFAQPPRILTQRLRPTIPNVTPAEGANWTILLGLDLPRDEAVKRSREGF